MAGLPSAVLAVALVLLSGGGRAAAFLFPGAAPVPPQAQPAAPVEHVAPLVRAGDSAPSTTLVSLSLSLDKVVPVDPDAIKGQVAAVVNEQADIIAQSTARALQRSLDSAPVQTITSAVNEAPKQVVGATTDAAETVKGYWTKGQGANVLKTLQSKPDEIASLKDNVSKQAEGYWTKGRGAEILKQVEQLKQSPPDASVVAAPLADVTNSAVDNVKGYWTKGRGKEVLETLKKVDVAEVVTSNAGAVAGVAVDALKDVVPDDPAELVPPEVTAALGDTVATTAKTTSRLLEYTSKNLSSGLAGTAASTTKALSSGVSGLTDSVSGTVSGLSKVGSGFGGEVAKAKASFARVAAQSKDLKVDPSAVTKKLQEAAAPLSAIQLDPDAIVAPVTGAVKGIDQSLKEGAEVLKRAQADIERGNKVAARQLNEALNTASEVSKTVAETAPAIANTVTKVVQDTTTVVTEVVPSVVPSVDVNEVTAQAQALAAAKANEAQEQVKGYWTKGRGKEILEQVEQLKQNPPDASVVAAPLADVAGAATKEVQGYWTKGRGAEILQSLPVPLN